MNNSPLRVSDLSAIEKRAEEIWKEVLDVPEGQEGATFFELQGQSISAVRIAARVEDELGIRVDVGDLFEDPDMEAFVRDVVTRAESLLRPERRSA